MSNGEEEEPIQLEVLDMIIKARETAAAVFEEHCQRRMFMGLEGSGRTLLSQVFDPDETEDGIQRRLVVEALMDRIVMASSYLTTGDDPSMTGLEVFMEIQKEAKEGEQ